MNFESKITGLCLYGFIKHHSQKEKDDCLKTIRQSYGNDIADDVTGYLKRNN